MRKVRERAPPPCVPNRNLVRHRVHNREAEDLLQGRFEAHSPALDYARRELRDLLCDALRGLPLRTTQDEAHRPYAEIDALLGRELPQQGTGN